MKIFKIKIQKTTLLFVGLLFFIGFLPNNLDAQTEEQIEQLLKDYDEVSAQEAFNFTKDYISSLGELKIAIERLAESEEGSEKEFEAIVNQMSSLKRANDRLDMAKSHLNAYLNSENKVFKLISNFTIMAFANLQNINSEILDVIEEIFNNEDEFKKGTMLRVLSDIKARANNQYELLINASIQVTHLFIDNSPDENGGLSYLRFTSSQREELINDLDLIYGDEIKEFEEGISYFNAIGATLRSVLSGEYKSAELRADE